MRITITPTASNTPTPSVTASQTPSYTPTGTVCPGLTPTATPTISITPSPTQTLTSTPTMTPTPSFTPGLSPTPTPSITPTTSQPCGTGLWTVYNYDCGLGTVNDVGINGCFMNSLPLGPSTFPLTSTLGGSKQSPNCVIDGTNNIQINLTTNIAGTGNCLVVVVYKNGVLFYTQYFGGGNGPAISIDPLELRICDDIEIGVLCFPTGCI